MARPRKQTVDYFPHDCDASERRTLTIVESKFGNDGYAFWFKLLQLLGKTPGHYYDFNAPADWEFLLAKTHVSEDTANSILEILVDLDAIDKDLAEKKIIWCQHFVDNVADVYKRREVELPTKPGDMLPESAFQIVQVSGDKRTLKELKQDAVADDLKVAGMVTYYEEQVGKTLTPNDLEKLGDFADTYSDGWFEKACDEAVKNNAHSLRYIEAILERWNKEGVDPLSDKPRRTKTSKGSPRELKDRKNYRTPDEHRRSG